MGTEQCIDDALDVLLEHIKDFDRVQEFAIRLDRTDVWLRLGIVSKLRFHVQKLKTVALHKRMGC